LNFFGVISRWSGLDHWFTFESLLKSFFKIVHLVRVIYLLGDHPLVLGVDFCVFSVYTLKFSLETIDSNFGSLLILCLVADFKLNLEFLSLGCRSF